MRNMLMSRGDERDPTNQLRCRSRLFGFRSLLPWFHKTCFLHLCMYNFLGRYSISSMDHHKIIFEEWKKGERKKTDYPALLLEEIFVSLIHLAILPPPGRGHRPDKNASRGGNGNPVNVDDSACETERFVPNGIPPRQRRHFEGSKILLLAREYISSQRF